MKNEIIDESNFDVEVLASKSPVLVKFGADWCGPCVRMKPVIEQYTLNNLGEVKVVDIDIDNCPKLTAKFGVRSVPTVLLFKDGKVVGTKVGFVSLTALNSFVIQSLNS